MNKFVFCVTSIEQRLRCLSNDRNVVGSFTTLALSVTKFVPGQKGVEVFDRSHVG